MVETFEEARKPVSREGVLFLLVDKGLYLTELRVKSQSGFHGRFRIPGGEIEHDELPVQAAFREAFEETGVVAKKIIFLDTFEDVTLNNQLVKLHAFLITEYVGQPKEMEPDKSLLRWLNIDDARDKLKLVSSRLVLNEAINLLSREN